jgi:hypothetical protein
VKEAETERETEEEEEEKETYSFLGLFCCYGRARGIRVGARNVVKRDIYIIRHAYTKASSHPNITKFPHVWSVRQLHHAQVIISIIVNNISNL